MRNLSKYTKLQILEAVSNSISIADVCRYLKIGTKGNNFITVKKYISLYNVDISHFKSRGEQLKSLHIGNKIPLSEILVENSTYSSSFNLKNRLLEENLKINICEFCGLDGFWNGKSLKMQLDHINGINTDNRIENLRLLCPNCHSQTETFCGKNNSKKSKKLKERSINGGKTNKQIKNYENSRIVIRPEKEILIKFIKEKGFLQTGKIYKVSDNAIRKWCKYYNLPTKIKYYKDM